MAETHAQFTGSIPELYDRHLGPVIFEPYALDLARRVAARANGPVLETACGPAFLRDSCARSFRRPSTLPQLISTSR